MKILFLPPNRKAHSEEDKTILETALLNSIYIAASCNSQGRCGKCRIIIDEGKVYTANRDLITEEEKKQKYYLACQTYPRSDLLVRIPEESRLSRAKVISEITNDTKGKNVGVGIDIGTTTVTANTIDAETGKTTGSLSSYNYQIMHGEDILTRINFCRKEEGLTKLHKLIINNINNLIKSLNPPKIDTISITGNTTMIYILLNKDPQIIKKNTQIGDFRKSHHLPASDIGLDIDCKAYILPGISNYVGGDITADILSSKLYKEKETCMLIDVGTNGEVVLGNKDWIITASTSAGPAFEGGEVRFGQRAMDGVIESITIKDQASFDVIGGGKPKGICGSALIDLIAELLKNKIIDRSGSFIKKFKVLDGEKVFVIARKDETSIGQDIYASETEIKNIIMSKAAIYAGFYTLLQTLNVKIGDVKKFFISGNFGNYLNIENAIAIGLLPNIPRNKFVFMGNGALKGACMTLHNKNERTAEEIAQKTEYLDLHTSEVFMDEYQKAMFLPHTEIERFD